MLAHQSNILCVLKGVLQGSILGPILFTLYINDFSISTIHQYTYDTIMYSVAPSADLALKNLQSDFHIIKQPS